MSEEMEAFASRAEAAVRVERSTAKRRIVEEPKCVSILDESQWTKGRGIALIHAESETLLGNFVEYLHPSGARKLVRETWPIAISAVERVEGSWWLGEGRKVEPRQEWHERRTIVMDLHLAPLGVHAPAVELEVHISYGGIARCELSVDTTFASTKEELSLTQLPSKTNILECMSLDAKIDLRREVGL